MIKETKLTSFLDNEYLKYAMHTLENRAIPSFIDGFKPIQRKIFFTSLNNIKKTSNKVSTLAGKVISEAMYHNGNISCEEAIVLMTQDFKNNIPYFKGIGQFGSLKNPFASSSRYISVVLNPVILDLFKDDELLESNIEDSVIVEPKYYLPIIPTVLINGTSGIALGYNTKILNRDPKDILNLCIKVLKNDKNINFNILPKISGFNGTIKNDSDVPKKWNFYGKFERGNNIIKITEIPPSMTYEKYEMILDKLVDIKEIISYENLSTDNINYVIKINKEKLNQMDDNDIIKFLKLHESETEIYNTLDENGNLKIFDCVEDIIKYFVNFRLTFYQKRKDFILEKLQHELKVLSQKGKFIKLILDGKIIVNNQPKDKILNQIESNNLEKIDDSYDYLLRLPIYSLTKEVFEKLKEDFTGKKEEIKVVEGWTPKNMYLEDLQELKKKLK